MAVAALVRLAAWALLPGARFASDEQGSSALAIDTVTWKTVDEINAWLDARYMEGTAPHHASGSNDIVQFTVANTLTPSHGALTGAGTGGIFDPAVVVGTDAVDEPSGGPSYVEGTTFVAVRDSKVVGTIQPREGGHGLFVDLESFPDRGNTQVAIFLQPDNAMTACPGVQLGTDWELYAVVGEAFVYPDGSVDAPTYAWKKIQPED